MNNSKSCGRCGQLKDVTEYYKCSTARGGIRPECKECTEKRREERLHSKMLSIQHSHWRGLLCLLVITSKNLRICNKCGEIKQLESFHKKGAESQERVQICKACDYQDFRARCRSKRESVNKYHREWRKNNTGKSREAIKKWHANNKETVKKWVDENRERVNERNRISSAKRRSNPKHRLNLNISTGISRSLKGNKKNRRWEALVDFTLCQLKRSLESKFKPGMSWENYGKWHVDHKIPLAAHNFERPEDIDFKKAWSLKNLQPLWAVENIKKHDRVEKPFQPSLSI